MYAVNIFYVFCSEHSLPNFCVALLFVFCLLCVCSFCFLLCMFLVYVGSQVSFSLCTGFENVVSAVFFAALSL